MAEDARLAFLEEQGVRPGLIDAIGDWRDAHPCPSDARYRIPKPQWHYLGSEVWTQAATALLCGQNLLLAGPKATGKNVLAQDLAFAFGRPQWNVSFHIDMDASFMIGTDTYAQGQVTFRPGPIARCATAGGFGVLDEINMARSEALAVLHACLDYRRIIDVPGYDVIGLDDATRFIATMNVGYAGTRELNEALGSRFAVIHMPVLKGRQLKDLLLQAYPQLTTGAAEQFATLFDEIRLKAEQGEITDRALDLRGLLGAIALMKAGLAPRQALQMHVSNKAFDGYERTLVDDLIATRLPKAIEASALFRI